MKMPGIGGWASIDYRADEIKAGPRTAGRTGKVVKFPKPTPTQR
jgi:hypothetical protein